MPEKKISRVEAIRAEISDPSLCGAIKRDGELCRNPAGSGTDHPGVGPCRFHDSGPMPRVLTSRGTRYGKHMRAIDAYMELIQDPEIKNLDEEIAFLRAKIQDIEDSIAELRAEFNNRRIPLNKEAANILARMTEQEVKLAEAIGKLVERKNRIEEGKLVTWRQVQSVLAQVIYVIKKHVSDETTLSRIAEDFRRIDVRKLQP